MRHAGGERCVSALVEGYLRTVHPDRRAVVHGAEMKQDPLVSRGRVLESAGVPDDIVKGRLPDAGELRLVAVRHSDLASERRIVRAQGRDVRILPVVGEPGVQIVEGEAPLAVQVCPVLAAELGTRVLGSWNRDQGAVPFLLEARAIRSEDRGQRSGRSGAFFKETHSVAVQARPTRTPERPQASAGSPPGFPLDGVPASGGGLYPGSRRRALLRLHRRSTRRDAACSNRW